MPPNPTPTIGGAPPRTELPTDFTVHCDTPDGPLVRRWSGQQVAKFGPLLRAKAERGQAWNIKVYGARQEQEPRDWAGEFDCFAGWTSPTRGTVRELREINLGGLDTDVETGEPLEVFVLTYKQRLDSGEWALVKRTLTRRGIENVGGVLTRMPVEKVYDLKVQDKAGGDVTFDFECFTRD